MVGSLKFTENFDCVSNMIHLVDRVKSFCIRGPRREKSVSLLWGCSRWLPVKGLTYTCKKEFSLLETPFLPMATCCLYPFVN